MHKAIKRIVLAFAVVATAVEDRGSACADDNDIGRGKLWVRSHSFWLSALTQSEPLFNANEYRGAGLNTLLAWDPKP